MKKNLFLIFFFFLFSVSFTRGYAQAALIDTLFSPRATFPIESVHVHCDKYVVPAGDTLWWKAYLFKGTHPSDISTNLYVELFSPRGRMLQQHIFPVLNSVSEGQVAFPDSLMPGMYWVRAYTRYQLNFDSSELFVAPVLVPERHVQTTISFKVPEKAVQGPVVYDKNRVLWISTPTDSSIVCHIEDSCAKLVGKPLVVVFASLHVPVIRASFSMSGERIWKDIEIPTNGIHGPADLLLFCGDSLLGHQTVELGPLTSSELDVRQDSVSIAPGGYNVWTVTTRDGMPFNCSISVTDADETVADPLPLTEHLTRDPLDYTQVGQRESSEVLFADTDFLTWRGRVMTAGRKPVGRGELVALFDQDTLQNVRPVVVPLDGQGRFAVKGGFFFDTATVRYQLNSFEGDPLAKNFLLTMESFRPPLFVLPMRGWKDTTYGLLPAPLDTEPHFPLGVRVTQLPEVVVKANVLHELDNRYATGIFTEPAPYAFDVRTDRTVTNIWMYLRKNLPAFEGGTDIGMPPILGSKFTLFYVDGNLSTADDVDRYWLTEIAYVKAYRTFEIDVTRFMQWLTGYKGFSIVSSGAGGLGIPTQNDVAVICIYTRQGKDIRSAPGGLARSQWPGFTRMVSWNPFSLGSTTLYWNPLVTKNEYTIRFYNRHATRYRLCVEGVSSGGKVIHFETIVQDQNLTGTARSLPVQSLP